MLKKILYGLILAVTAVRALDMVYLLIKGSTNVPVPVLAVTGCMIVYGSILLIRKLFVNVTLRQMMAFFVVASIAIVFNLTYVAVACPLSISAAETLVVGTFFDIMMNLIVIYAATKQLRSHYFAIAQPVASTNRHA